jgi:hypothetical protein
MSGYDSCALLTPACHTCSISTLYRHTQPVSDHQSGDDCRLQTSQMMQAFFVRNTSHPAGTIRNSFRSTRSSPPPPLLGLIAPPQFPDAAKTSLASMRPLTFVTCYDCEQRCRSFGICIHFQFCCGVKNCPDGLVCERCLGNAPEFVCG